MAASNIPAGFAMSAEKALSERPAGCGYAEQQPK
jgi:hypothetical protein